MLAVPGSTGVEDRLPIQRAPRRGASGFCSALSLSAYLVLATDGAGNSAACVNGPARKYWAPVACLAASALLRDTSDSLSPPHPARGCADGADRIDAAASPLAAAAPRRLKKNSQNFWDTAWRARARDATCTHCTTSSVRGGPRGPVQLGPSSRLTPPAPVACKLSTAGNPQSSAALPPCRWV
eukprot:COSAG01_NODE_1672_length_9554_cov_4.065785_13_plen_183_part_00